MPVPKEVETKYDKNCDSTMLKIAEMCEEAKRNRIARVVVDGEWYDIIHAIAGPIESEADDESN